ncbi:VOC family protein [Streptomyces sp. NPDC051322]|uniref:VOC family protein n=1 Tax=Streptomyces sp. NPDC051322 TaxID=3154645 RepID=UPI0034506F61
MSRIALISLVVRDYEDFAGDQARMIAAGVRFLEEPRHEPYGTVAVFEDLYGNRWDLLQPA